MQLTFAGFSTPFSTKGPNPHPQFYHIGTFSVYNYYKYLLNFYMRCHIFPFTGAICTSDASWRASFNIISENLTHRQSASRMLSRCRNRTGAFFDAEGLFYCLFAGLRVSYGQEGARRNICACRSPPGARFDHI